jgi:5'-3' exonuclease
MGASEYMLEYACGMSLLGNDFLPHSLSVKMREGGHDLLCRALAEAHAAGLRLVGPDQKVVVAVVLKLVGAWAEKEEEWIAENFEHKYKTRPMPPRNERERLMADVERLPLEWRAEDVLWNQRGFVPEWRDKYRERLLHGSKAVAEYFQGLQWIIDYYTGRAVSYAWYFPWNVPPLWSDFEAVIATAAPVTLPVAPQEQLAMVLPMDSWWLVRDLRLRALPAKLPAYWPKRFGFFSVGRRWLWECEAEVPILTAERLRRGREQL